VFCWRQPFRSRAEPDFLPEAPGRRGVVLVHGFVCNRGLWNPMMAWLRSRGVPFVAVNLEPVFGSIDRYADIVEAAVRRVEAATGQPPVIVAHSMGGLATRAWMAAHDADERVHRVITIGTPHHGTLLGGFGHTRNAREMRLGSDWQRRLSAREPPGRFERFTCFYGHCDNIVFPASSATLPGADNRHVASVAHVQMAHQDEVWNEVLRWVGSATDMPRTAPARRDAEAMR
jgi:triacylglycerol esterase/lipase EstA (alpha/beta hydrolase family)